MHAIFFTDAGYGCSGNCMIIETTDNRKVFVRRLNSGDLDSLLYYLEHLSATTKKRFGPHKFDKQSVIDFYDYPDIHWGYVAENVHTQEIIAYSIIKIGYLESDYNRFLNYGIVLDSKTDCELAPSVADLWQGCGIGRQLLGFILADIRKHNIQRVILWGGVQADNDRAVHYYTTNNFKLVGQFSHNGENLDMLLHL